jgi:hypothetical protein
MLVKRNSADEDDDHIRHRSGAAACFFLAGDAQILS